MDRGMLIHLLVYRGRIMILLLSGPWEISHKDWDPSVGGIRILIQKYWDPSIDIGSKKNLVPTLISWYMMSITAKQWYKHGDVEGSVSFHRYHGISLHIEKTGSFSKKENHWYCNHIPCWILLWQCFALVSWFFYWKAISHHISVMLPVLTTRRLLFMQYQKGCQGQGNAARGPIPLPIPWLSRLR